LRRCAYQANVMKMFESVNNPTVVSNTLIRSLRVLVVIGFS
jgi:hypothetical protein